MKAIEGVSGCARMTAKWKNAASVTIIGEADLIDEVLLVETALKAEEQTRLSSTMSVNKAG